MPAPARAPAPAMAATARMPQPLPPRPSTVTKTPPGACQSAGTGYGDNCQNATATTLSHPGSHQIHWHDLPRRVPQ
eukprot:3755328-Rhodomonas_salina.1